MPASAEAPISHEQAQRQRVIALKARYKADALRLLADPQTKREHLDGDQDLLSKFDALHAPSIPRSPQEVSGVIESLITIDGPRPGLTLPDPKMGHYISGLLSSLGDAIGVSRYAMQQGNVKPRRYIGNQDSNQDRQVMIQRLADVLADKKLIEAGAYENKDFLRTNPHFVDTLDGYIAGYEWALGRREDTGVDVRAEIDRFPYHPLRTPIAQETAK